MTKACPICNFELKSCEENLDFGVYRVTCHECGIFMIEKNCAQDFRRKYLSFDVSTIGGQELYNHNLKLVRSYLARHHKEVLNNSVLQTITGLYTPR
ncbi:MAG TPA: hypothetical protein VNJ29_01835 [Candidatus Nitrosotenuis sp.]|jgi:hypothetical protein|nr:hypothetical protein [Candidatus Nitrosotenuis sp.]